MNLVTVGEIRAAGGVVVVCRRLPGRELSIEVER